MQACHPNYFMKIIFSSDFRGLAIYLGEKGDVLFMKRIISFLDKLLKVETSRLEFFNDISKTKGCRHKLITYSFSSVKCELGNVKKLCKI